MLKGDCLTPNEIQEKLNPVVLAEQRGFSCQPKAVGQRERNHMRDCDETLS